MRLRRGDGRPGSTRLLLTTFVAVTTVAIVAQTWWAIEQDRRLTLDSERENGMVAVRLLEEHANQQLAAAAQRLNVVAYGTSVLLQHERLGDKQVQEIIEDSLRNSRSDGALQFVNTDGERWASMFDFPAFVFMKEAREYIAFLLEHPGHKDIVVGHPFHRSIDGALVLPLARNLYDYKGRHAGLISTEIELDYFNRVYDRVAKSSKAVAQLFADAGFVIVRSPFDAQAVNLDISRTALFQRLRSAAAEGALEEAAMVSGKRHLFTYRKVHGFHLTIVFGRELDDVLANWSLRTWDRITFSGVFVALHLLLTYYLLVHMQRLQLSKEKLRQSEARFVDLFRHAPIPLALMRIDTNQIIEANDAILAQFGYARAEFIGKTSAELHMWVNQDARQPYLDLLARQQYVDRLEVLLRNKDGSVSVCLLSTRLIESDGIPVAIFSPNDVTRQHEVENEIRELNAELDQRVRQRTLNLQEALAKVKNMQGELVRSEKLAALGSLVAGVAHELNTPVGNSVTVASTTVEYAASLRMELQDAHPRRSQLVACSKDIADGLDILMRNLHRVAALVASFKQVAVDQSSDERRVFDLRGAITEVMLTLEPICRQRRHVLQLELTADVQMDSYPGALSQAIASFVNNALSHAFEGCEGGTIRIGTRVLDADLVELVFSDNGQGIASEHLGRVFDPFFTTKLGQGGSGLGMHIVYNLVTGVLGGTIVLASTKGEGTTITMVLPRSAPTFNSARHDEAQPL